MMGGVARLAGSVGDGTGAHPPIHRPLGAQRSVGRSDRHPGCSTHAGLVIRATDSLTTVAASSIPNRRPFNSASGTVDEMFRVPSPAMGVNRRLRRAEVVVHDEGISPEGALPSSPWKMRCCTWRTQSRSMVAAGRRGGRKEKGKKKTNQEGHTAPSFVHAGGGGRMGGGGLHRLGQGRESGQDLIDGRLEGGVLLGGARGGLTEEGIQHTLDLTEEPPHPTVGTVAVDASHELLHHALQTGETAGGRVGTHRPRDSCP